MLLVLLPMKWSVILPMMLVVIQVVIFVWSLTLFCYWRFGNVGADIPTNIASFFAGKIVSGIAFGNTLSYIDSDINMESAVTRNSGIYIVIDLASNIAATIALLILLLILPVVPVTLLVTLPVSIPCNIKKFTRGDIATDMSSKLHVALQIICHCQW